MKTQIKILLAIMIVVMYGVLAHLFVEDRHALYVLDVVAPFFVVLSSLACFGVMILYEKIQNKKIFVGVFFAFLLLFVPQIAHAELTDGLVSYWAMDETSGNQSVNSVVGKNNLSWIGEPSIVDTQNVKGRLMNGASYANTGIYGTRAASTSVCVWVNQTVIVADASYWGARNSGNTQREVGQTSAPTGSLRYLRYNSGNYTFVPLDLSNWHHVCIVENTTNPSPNIYVDGAVAATAAPFDFALLTVNAFVGAKSNNGVPVNYWTGALDELGIWNRTLTSDEVAQLYNAGAGLTYPFVTSAQTQLTFVSQEPEVLNYSATVSGVNITYNVSYGNQTRLFYFVNSTDALNDKYVNGTRYGIENVSGINITAYVENNTQYKFLVDENYIPGSYNFLNVSGARSVLSGGTNYLFSVELLNVSSTKEDNVFEFMFNGSSAHVYYCNSSYSYSSPVTSSPNCFLFYTENTPNTPDHVHGTNIFHHVIPFSIIDGKVGNVSVTPTSNFIIEPVGGTLNTFYVNQSVRTNSSRFSSANGNTWAQVNGTFEAHLHQWGNGSYLNYYACANSTINSSIVCSDVVSSALTVEGIPPTTPQIHSVPFLVSDTFDVLWTQSFSYNGIASYELSLYDDGFIFVDTLYNASNTFFSWNTSQYSDGLYYLAIKAFGVGGLVSNTDFSILFGVNNSFPTTPNFEIYPTEASGSEYISWNASSGAFAPITYNLSLYTSLNAYITTLNLTSALNYSWDTTMIADGKYKLGISASDDNGKLSNVTLSEAIDVLNAGSGGVVVIINTGNTTNTSDVLKLGSQQCPEGSSSVLLLLGMLFISLALIWFAKRERFAIMGIAGGLVMMVIGLSFTGCSGTIAGILAGFGFITAGYFLFGAIRF